MSEDLSERSENSDHSQKRTTGFGGWTVLAVLVILAAVLFRYYGPISTDLFQPDAELRTVAVDLAIQAAEKLLTKNLDDATQRRLVEDYLADLEKSGDSSSLPS